MSFAKIVLPVDDRDMNTTERPTITIYPTISTDTVVIPIGRIHI